MTILQQIQTWSETLPLWQRDAIARLYARTALTPDDYSAIYAHLKSEHGIPDPAGREPTLLTAEQVTAPGKPGRRVQLASIKTLRNVNAMASIQRQAIPAQGLRII